MPDKIVPGIEYWSPSRRTFLREITEVLGVEAVVSLVGWFSPLSYHAMGHVYLLMVIALSMRVGRWPVLVAAVVSAVAWDFVFIPPQLSFSLLDLDEALTLGAYFFAALIGGQLMARLRGQERYERQREQRATALFHLTRALANARSLDEAVKEALRQADALFGARTALLVSTSGGGQELHPASSLSLTERERSIAAWVAEKGRPGGRYTGDFASVDCLHLPLRRADITLGVLVLCFPPEIRELTAKQHDLVAGFATQIALLIERERLREAGEREKMLAESERLHRTLLDSVSHELKTPLSILRAATDKLDSVDETKRALLTGEIRTATNRLDHLVANLLNQTRLDSGMLRPQLDWCDARDLIATARRAVGPALDGRPLSVEVPADQPLFFVDAVLMEHVLANLLLNAALHTPAGTAVVISAGIEKERVYISVADNGPGLPPATQARAFEKFCRGPSSRPGGLGLGLSIVRGFTVAQGGEVETSLGPLGGACFTVYLPHATHGHVPNDEH